tara:strand:- start:7142 stop:7294 length:153 start_codon:yes stop_codon:yes gene_type:complete
MRTSPQTIESSVTSISISLLIGSGIPTCLPSALARILKAKELPIEKDKSL